MKPRAFQARAERIIDALSIRIELQTFRAGADAPRAVAAVGAFHAAAGRLERDVQRPTCNRATVATLMRALRNMVRVHAIIVDRRGR